MLLLLVLLLLLLVLLPFALLLLTPRPPGDRAPRAEKLIVTLLSQFTESCLPMLCALEKRGVAVDAVVRTTLLLALLLALLLVKLLVLPLVLLVLTPLVQSGAGDADSTYKATMELLVKRGVTATEASHQIMSPLASHSEVADMRKLAVSAPCCVECPACMPVLCYSTDALPLLGFVLSFFRS